VRREPSRFTARAGISLPGVLKSLAGSVLAALGRGRGPAEGSLLVPDSNEPAWRVPGGGQRDVKCSSLFKDGLYNLLGYIITFFFPPSSYTILIYESVRKLPSPLLRERL